MKTRWLMLAALTLVLGLRGAKADEAKPKKPEAPPGTVIHRDLAYVANGHERQKLDLYLPPEAEGPLPVIVWIHGGAWRAGSKSGCRSAPFVARGYAAASINYRYSDQAPFPAQIEDCKSAIRWLRANAKKYKLDADRIGVWGASAGGHLVALLGTTGDVKEFDKGDNTDQSSRVQAVVDWYGPTDFLQMPRADDPTGPVARLLGGTINDKKELAAKASPITHVTKDAAPFLIMQGDMDKLVPVAQSQTMIDALEKAGVAAKLQVYKGAGHAPFTSDDATKLIEEFFDKHLKK